MAMVAIFAPEFAAAYINGADLPLNPGRPTLETMTVPILDSSIDPSEVAKFAALAAEWWDPAGKFAPLHKFNPVRLAFIRQEAAARFGRDGKSLRPFEGLSLLDIGCGGGLLSEPMARLGFAVTGADASERNIGTARTHAAESGVPVDYRAASAEMLAAEGLISGGLCRAGEARRNHHCRHPEQDPQIPGPSQDRRRIYPGLAAARHP
jgi:hypothetical protein